jgi:methionyl-tRNA synthetase
MSMNEPLPKKVLGHGWLLLNGGKISKSKKSVGNVVDPVVLIERYGVDALKYFLLREYTFGQDGLFTNEAMLGRLNADLANDLGNLLSRTTGMAEKFLGGNITGGHHHVDAPAAEDVELKDLAVSTGANIDKYMEAFEFNHALEEIWTLVRRSNKYIDETSPWSLAKDEKQALRLGEVLYNLAETLRIISILICPFLHHSSEEIRRQLGLGEDAPKWADASEFGIEKSYRVVKGPLLFPRLDIEEELAELAKLIPDNGNGVIAAPEPQSSDTNQPDSKGNHTNSGVIAAPEPQSSDTANQPTPVILGEVPESSPSAKPEIQYDDFAKLDLRVGLVLECYKHPDADKLLVFKIKMGDEERQIVSGVADVYAPGDCIGRKVIVVANLAPRMLRGEESRGMLLFADNGDRFEFVTTDAPDGEAVT